MKRYILVVLALCVLIGIVSADDWLLGWDYRQVHNITGNTTWPTQTNYQVKFIVNTSVGTSSGDTIYTNGHTQADLDDLRFTSSDSSTVYDYWIESTSNPFTVWVEVPTLTNGTNQIAVYYGNSTATSVSNGTNTFSFFDHFEGSALDTTKWETRSNVEGGTITVSGSQLMISVPDADNFNTGIRSNQSFGANTQFNAKIDSHVNTVYGPLSKQDPPWYGDASDQFEIYGTCYYTDYGLRVNSTRYHIGFEPSTPYMLTVSWLDNVVRVQTSDGKDSGWKPKSMLEYPNRVALFARDQQMSAGGSFSVDLVFVRSYYSPEPTHSTWYPIETIPTLDAEMGTPIPESSSGYAPLLVSFFDSSTSTNCTIDYWNWSFGDGFYSNNQNPQHEYLSSGIYTYDLTVGNTTYCIYNTASNCGVGPVGICLTKYEVLVNTDIPVADFTVTETCGDVGDTFYFIDFSTGGGLYAWNWSFGDGSYSELRNPTHQYAANGTYDVNLSVWGAYGFDSLLRENLITIPCGAATPTPTPTVTVTGTPTATGPVPTAEVNETDVGETWIRWVWEDPGEPVDIYIDGAKVESWVNNTTQAYRLTGLNPSERHVLSLYRAGNATLIDQQDVTTLPATWLIVSVLAISIFFAVCTIISRDIYRVLLCSTIACVSSGFLAMIGVGHPWGITIIGIIVALITGVIAVIVALDLRNGDDDE